MAIEHTPRLGLTQWTDPNLLDPVHPDQFNADAAALDDLAAIAVQGTAAERPAFGVRGRFYYATDTGDLTYDTGTAWTAVGATDAAVAGFVEDPASQTNAALAGTYASHDEVTAARGHTELLPVTSPSEMIARTLDFRSGSPRIAIAGDSTWNDGNDMPMKWGIRMGQITPPDFSVRMKTFNTDLQQYNQWTIIKAGDSIPGSGGVYLADDFNRTAAELVGSTTSGGQVWGGVAGVWSADGALAHALAATHLDGSLSYDAGASDVTATAVLNVITATNSDAPQLRIVVGADSATIVTDSNYVYAQLGVTSTGTPGLSIWKRINGTSTQLGTTDYSTGLTNAAATPQLATLTIQVDGLNITVTLTPQDGVTKEYTAVLTETEYDSLGTYFGVSAGNNVGDYLRLDSIEMESPLTPESYTGIEMWNGAVPGSNLPYQQSRMELLYPSATLFDALIVSGGHNKGAASPDEFITEVDSFVSAFQAAHPEALILVSSQNPEFPPAPNMAVHADRQAALREYAMSKGFEYLPVFEAFAAQEDGGASLVQSDGIHPTYPGTTPSDGIWSLDWSGTVLWAAVWMEAINARRVTGMPPLTELP